MGTTAYNALTLFSYYLYDRYEKSGKKFNRFKNDVEFRNLLVDYSNLWMNMFEFEGMPDTVNHRHMMEVLYGEGKALFYNDPEMGFTVLECAEENGLNVYYEPTAYTAVGNELSRSVLAEDSVLIRVNQAMYPPLFTLEMECLRMMDARRTIDTYAKTMKKPWLLPLANGKDDKLTYKTIKDQIDDNEIAIFVDGRMSDSELPRPYPNQTTDANGLMSLWRHYHELQDHTLTWFGVNNSDTSKRERMITDEANSNNVILRLNIDKTLDWLKLACEQINEKFGLSVSAKVKHDYVEEVLKTDVQPDKESPSQDGQHYKSENDN